MNIRNFQLLGSLFYKGNLDDDDKYKIIEIYNRFSPKIQKELEEQIIKIHQESLSI
jgi:hypothetical protein